VGGHVFQFDPRSQVDGLLESGNLTIERDGFFETPPAVVKRMTELVWPSGKVLEPSAGLGAIVDHLPIEKTSILCIEKNTQRVADLKEKGYTVQCGDFLTMTPGKFDAIFMNPPFEEGQEIDHVQHAFSCLAPGGGLVSVMSAGPFFRGDRKAVAFREWFESADGTKESLPPESFKVSGTGVNTCLVVVRNVTYFTPQHIVDFACGSNAFLQFADGLIANPPYIHSPGYSEEGDAAIIFEIGRATDDALDDAPEVLDGTPREG
jgi:hypothetical protein